MPDTKTVRKLMIVKVIELRDRLTFIPCIAIKLSPQKIEEAWLIQRAGYGPSTPYVLFGRADCGIPFQYDPSGFGDRTMTAAHQHIIENFDEIEHGGLVDVEFILGETEEPKTSERDSPY